MNPKDANRVQKASLILLGATVVVLAVLLVFALENNGDDSHQDKELKALVLGNRLTQFTNCVQSPLRGQVRDEFVDLKKDVLITVFEGVEETTPAGTPTELRELFHAAVEYLNYRIATIYDRIPDPNCLELYPPLEGQKYPKELIEADQEEGPTGPTPPKPKGFPPK